MSADLQIRKLHPALGAEVRGVDFKSPLDKVTVDGILKAWADHLVLVFPDQAITDEEHVKVTHYFGEPEVFHQKHSEVIGRPGDLPCLQYG